MDIHPMLVHFPVALLLASVLFDVLGLIRRDERLHFAAHYTLVAGVAGGLFAAVSGFLAAERMQERFARLREAMAAAGGDLQGAGAPAPGFGAGGFPGFDQVRVQMAQNLDVHRLLALAALAVFVALLLWRVSRKGVPEGRSLATYLVVAVLGAGILTSAAFYGGQLSHGRRGGPDGNRPGFVRDRPADATLPFEDGRAPRSGSQGSGAAPAGGTGGTASEAGR